MPDRSSILAVALGLVLGTVIVVIASYLRRQSRTGIRPAGVAVVSVIQLGLGTFYFLGLSLALWSIFRQPDQLAGEMKQLGTTSAKFVSSLITHSGLALLGGYGLWRGKPWGWRVAIFAVACGIARNVLSLLLDRHAIQQVGQSEAFFYAQHTARAAFGLAMLLYLYRADVLWYCSLALGRLAHARSLAVSVVLAIGLELIQRP